MSDRAVALGTGPSAPGEPDRESHDDQGVLGRTHAKEPDRGRAVEVSTIAELDDVLDQVAAQASRDGVPYGAQIHNPDAPGSIMIGIGHERSFLDWLDADGSRTSGHDPALPPWTEPIGFDLYGNWHEYEPAETRVTSAAARDAARAYVTSGQRPNQLTWS